MVNKELKDLYELVLYLDEKYPGHTGWFEEQNKAQYNIALIFSKYLANADDQEARALDLVMCSLRLLYDFSFNESYKNAVSNLFMLLLENDPRLYTNVNKAFYRLIHQSANEYKETIEEFKDVIDGIQIGIKEKEYKTPFYNVTQGKYDGPYLTFDYSDPALKQKIETVIFPKLQQVLKEKYGDQVEAELRSNGQIWLKKWSDIPLGAGEINIMVNQISMKG